MAVLALGAGLVASLGVAHAAPPVEHVMLTAFDGFPEDNFGASVGVSGDTIVVGAPFLSDFVGDPGSAYVYTSDGLGGYGETKLTASDRADYDSFGHSVAVSGDTVVVGAFLDDDGGSNTGSVYVYTPDGLGGYSEAKLTASDAATFDFFGFRVAVSGDTIVVGAYSDDDGGSNTGSVYVYTPDGLGGYAEAKLTASDPAAFDFFGTSVAVSGNTIVVGTLDDDGGMDSGSVYVYTPDGLGGYSEAKLTASDPAAFDYFGASVGVSGDTIVVGAWGDDGPTDAGSAYVYTPDGLGGYGETKLTASDAGADNRFGDAVGVSGDTIVVGAYLDDGGGGSRSGSAYVYTPDGLGGYGEAKLTASDAAASDGFGASVGLSGDTLVVGAPRVDYPAAEPGSAYVFAPAPATAPGAPTIGSATAGNAEATVSWSAPAADGGSPIIGYVVTPYVGFYPFAPVTFHSTATTQVVTGRVSNGPTYRFRVQAINAIGTGAYSKASNAVTASTTVAPGLGAPTVLQNATGGPGQSATVSWTPPTSNGGSAVTGYVVTPYVGYFPFPSYTFHSTATTETLTQLYPGFTYKFRVQATNANGTGASSKATNAVTPSP